MLIALNLENLAEASFPQKVSLLKQLFGFSWQDFALALNVNEKTVRRWESGVSSPVARTSHAIEALVNIAQTLGDIFQSETIQTWVLTP